jgi:hypothetical protein
VQWRVALLVARVHGRRISPEFAMDVGQIALGLFHTEENKRLKKLLAEAELDKAILKEALEGN